MDAIKNYARTLGTTELVKAVKMIGGTDSDRRIARAAMFSVIEERMGGDYLDALMNEMGLM